LSRAIINLKEKKMKFVYPALLVLLFLPLTLSAHSGADPAAEVAKKRSYVLRYQQDYLSAASKKEKISNIKKQISTLQSTTLLFRNSLSKENSSIRSEFSSYEIDYLAVMKNSLKDLQKLLRKFDAIVED